MERFYLNGIPWRVYYVQSDCPYLVDRTGSRRLATTDIRTNTIYIYEGLSGSLLRRVTIHEIGHAAMKSFGIIDEKSKSGCVISWLTTVLIFYGLEKRFWER